MLAQGPLVSVLMTAYNREKYLAQAIESILVSTYQNFEVIIVDDSSSDRTVEIAKLYEAKDGRVRVYVNGSNLGDYPNRNKAAFYATGKYLKYVDADDYIYPWGLELLVKMMEQFPDAGWGLCSLTQDIGRPFPFALTPAEAYRYEFFGPGLFYRSPLSSIIKKEAFEKIGGFNDIRMAGDYDMWFRLASRYPVVLMPYGMIWYRQHPEQEMVDYSKFTGKYEEVLIKNIKFKDCPLNATEKIKALHNRRMQLFKDFIVNMIKMNITGIKMTAARIYEHFRKQD